MRQHQIENIIAQFELGNINKQQAVRMHLEDIGDLDENTIENELEKLSLASKEMEWFLDQHPTRRIDNG
jgi:DNA gyrase/topoisomerase IV subunit A